MKTIAILLLSSFCLFGEEEPERPLKKVPYLRTQVVKFEKGKKTVKIMVWAKNIPLKMTAWRKKGDPKPLIIEVKKGESWSSDFAATNDYIIQIEWEGEVIDKVTPRDKGGL